MIIPSRVVIVGGTHGNEWTGIQVVRHYQETLRNKFPELQIEFIFANPEAHKLNCRFKEEDLNRAFEFLDQKRESYEHKRAQEIKTQIQSSLCMVIDLHTTTAHMGNTVIISHYNSFNLSVCSQLAQHFPNFRVIGAPDPKKKYLASQSEYGVILEIGPVPNGVVAGVPLEATLNLIESILEVIQGKKIPPHGSVEVFEEAQDIYYPQNEKGELNGYIHSEFQGQNFKLLDGEYLPFKTFDGEDFRLQTGEKLYPIFINEAAYYRANLAFTLCRKKTLTF